MIKAEMSYSEEHFTAISGKGSKISPIEAIGAVFFAVMSTFIIILSIIKHEKPDVIYVITACCLWIAIIFVALLKIFLSPKRQFERYCKNFPNSKVAIAFEDEQFSFSCSSDVTQGSSLYKYSVINKVDERDGFFVINISGVGITAFKYSEITEGTAEELRNLLKAKLGDNRYTA